MKKSKMVNLVLVASVKASCSSKDDYVAGNSRMYVRSDSTSQYSQTPYHGGGGYYHFIPFGFYQPLGGYRHGGYQSSAFSSKAGNHAISRGGFGGSGVRVGG
jgi:hypothetical protein